ncbi:MAG TPA: ATP-binding protein [Crinalium sp.]
MPPDALMTPQKSARQRQQRILEILSALSYRTGELKRYLNEIAQGVSELIALDWSTVTLCRDGSERVLASTIDLGEDGDQVYELHGTLTGTVCQTGCPLVVEDALVTTEYGEAPEGYRAYLGVPLRTPDGEVIGTICSFQHQPRYFTEEEVRLVELFAERAATAIDNYELYQQQQQFNEALEDEVIKRTIELRATQSKLLEANSQLELRVEQRTAELRQVNQRLQAEIDERKQAEEKLRQSEEQLRQIAENMSQVLWMYSQDGKPIYINPAFEKIWQRSCQDWYIDSAACWDAIHPDDRDRVRTAFEQALEHGYQEEYRIIRPDGSVRIIRDQAFPICDETGQVYRLAGIAEDITERRQAHQDMMKAIASLAEVGELASMIVHEIRNPLTTILMGLNSFKRMSLPASAQERLALSLDEAERLRGLLNEILLYAKPHALQCCELELNGFITELLGSIRAMPSAMQRQIEFVPADQPIKIKADKDKLKQIFINLIDNACEAVPDGETITWQIEPKGQRVHIHVRNGGEPIPPDVLPKLTKPFYTTKSSGTGLGLAIVKRIVDAHGGELSIESCAAQGTTVSVKWAIAHS